MRTRLILIVKALVAWKVQPTKWYVLGHTYHQTTTGVICRFVHTSSSVQTVSKLLSAPVPVNALFDILDRYTSSSCHFAPSFDRDSLGLQTYTFALEEDLAKAQEHMSHMGKASDGTSAKRDEILQAAARQVSTPRGILYPECTLQCHDIPYGAVIYPKVS